MQTPNNPKTTPSITNQKSKMITEKVIPKIVFLAVGAGSTVMTAIKNKVEIMPNLTTPFEYLHFDTSYSDEVDYAETLIMGGNGSGGKRATNYERITESSARISKMLQCKDSLYVLIAPTAGGTSIVSSVLLSHLKDLNMMVISIEDTTHGTYMENTSKSYLSMELFASQNGSLTIYPIDNSKFDGYSDGNEDIANFVVGLSLLCGDNKGLDFTDMMGLFNPDEYLKDKHHNILYKLNLTQNTLDPKFTMIAKELVMDGNYNGKREHIDGPTNKQGQTKYPLDLYTDEETGEPVHKLILSIQMNQFDKFLNGLDEDIIRNEDEEPEAHRRSLPKVTNPDGQVGHVIV